MVVTRRTRMDSDSTLTTLGIKPLGTASYVPVTLEEIAQLETLLGASLPSDYKAFILKYGASHFSRIVEVRPIQAPPAHITADGLLDFSFFYGSNIDGRGLLDFVAVLQGRMPSTMF